MADQNRLSLFVPEWQGYALDTSPMAGAHSIRNWIFRDTPFVEINIDESALPPTENCIQGYRAIKQTLIDIEKTLAHHAPDFVFTLGGT